jgi:hypothetical protein
MSLQKLAQQVRAKGRGDDTELVHFTKGELNGLHGLARAMYGQDLPINPETGLHEAGWLKKLLPTIVGAAASYFGGSPMVGALAGAATGALTNKNDRMAGALAGGAGGYGGATLMNAGLSAGTAAQGAQSAGPELLGGTPAITDVAQQAAAPVATSQWDKLQSGIGALMEKPENIKGALGGSYAPIAYAALPLAMQDTADPQSGGQGGSGKDPARRKYGFEWVQDENGVYQGKYTRRMAAGGLPGADGKKAADYLQKAAGATGGKQSQEAINYLFGLGELDPLEANATKVRAANPRKPAELPTSGGGGGGTSNNAEGGLGLPPLEEAIGSGGNQLGGGAGGDGINQGSAGGFDQGFDPNYATPPTGGQIGDIGQGPGSVSGDAGFSADTIGKIAGGIGLITGIPGLGTIADASGASQGISDWMAERAGQANRDSVASVSPDPGPNVDPTDKWASEASRVDNAPLQGEVQDTTAATPGASGTGSAASDVGTQVFQDALAEGYSEQQAADFAQAAARDMMQNYTDIGGFGGGAYAGASDAALGGSDVGSQAASDAIADSGYFQGLGDFNTGAATSGNRYLGSIGGGGGIGRSSKFRTSQVQLMADGGPVALQSGGFVFPADVVSALGAGSSGAGLEVLAKRYGARPVAGKGHGQSDDVHATIDGQQPARVARDEAVLDAAQVKKAGGAKKLYAMMERVRKQATGSPKQMRAIDANKALR